MNAVCVSVIGRAAVGADLGEPDLLLRCTEGEYKVYRILLGIYSEVRSELLLIDAAEYTAAKTLLNGGKHYRLSRNALVIVFISAERKVAQNDNIPARALALLGAGPILEQSRPIEAFKDLCIRLIVGNGLEFQRL